MLLKVRVGKGLHLLRIFPAKRGEVGEVVHWGAYRYPFKAAAKSVVGRGSLFFCYWRAIAREHVLAFFMSTLSCYGGCARGTRECAGFQ
jgi:hypothetical protein